ncbi:hypothetical protein [Kitasatospora sp. NPDC057223]|uniref:hypothetical protein n=1 Tax=Kitasatospora sp. NPDC057223 TaxID=3346055 RepID=UPI0036256672
MTMGHGAGRHRRSAESWKAMTRELAQLGEALAEQQRRLAAAADLITGLTAERDALRAAASAAGPRPRTAPERFRHGVRAARQQRGALG